MQSLETRDSPYPIHGAYPWRVAMIAAVGQYFLWHRIFIRHGEYHGLHDPWRCFHHHATVFTHPTVCLYVSSHICQNESIVSTPPNGLPSRRVQHIGKNRAMTARCGLLYKRCNGLRKYQVRLVLEVAFEKNVVKLQQHFRSGAP
eukprot:8460009-Pyramimonas_sp.AAC.2